MQSTRWCAARGGGGGQPRLASHLFGREPAGAGDCGCRVAAPRPGQKLLNIATRAAVGAGDNTLIAGFVVPPGSAKTVLVRGVGPGLTPFGVGRALAQPASARTASRESPGSRDPTG